MNPIAPDTANPPLALDLDGTMIKGDSLMETARAVLVERPWLIFAMIYWLLFGRPRLKAEIAKRYVGDGATWPAHEALCAYAQAQADLGRTVILATATDQGIAHLMARRFPFVSEVLASDGVINLKSEAKAQALHARFPEGFAYAGDSSADLAVWARAKAAIYAGTSEVLARQAYDRAPCEVDFRRPKGGLKAWIRALRIHQWAKNLLVFVPLGLGPRFLDASAWGAALAGFLALSVLASSTYLINDLVDLDHDRAHWSKRHRPLAAGDVALPHGALAALVGMIGALAFGFAFGGAAAALPLVAYAVLTLTYSFALKAYELVDVAAIAGLFCLRLAVGAAFIDVPLSSWLIVFAMSLFFSLGLAKRATELGRAKAKGQDDIAGRGYRVEDFVIVASFGAALAVSSILIFVLYMTEEAFVKNRFPSPVFLWIIPLALVLWLARVWLLVGRGELHDDPLVFALSDRKSWALGALTLVAFALARLVGL